MVVCVQGLKVLPLLLSDQSGDYGDCGATNTAASSGSLQQMKLDLQRFTLNHSAAFWQLSVRKSKFHTAVDFLPSVQRNRGPQEASDVFPIAPRGLFRSLRGVITS